jgi:MFS family permease
LEATPVLPRLLDPRARDRHTYLGALALGLVAAALLSGWLWSSVGRVELAGYELLDWHYVLGFVLTLAVVAHLVVRAKAVRRRDLWGRRQFLSAAGVAIFAAATWRVQRPLEALIGLPSAKRRFTGSYEEGSFEGNSSRRRRGSPTTRVPSTLHAGG